MNIVVVYRTVRYCSALLESFHIVHSISVWNSNGNTGAALSASVRKKKVLYCAVGETIFFIIKPTRCTNFQNLLRHETLHVSGSSSVHHHEFIHCTLGAAICHTGLKTAFEQDQDGTSWSCSKAVFKAVWHIAAPSVQWINSWWWTEELPETCRVSCRSKFRKLVHLVGFIIKKIVTMHGHVNFRKIRWNRLTVCSSSLRTASVSLRFPHNFQFCLRKL